MITEYEISKNSPISIATWELGLVSTATNTSCDACDTTLKQCCQKVWAKSSQILENTKWSTSNTCENPKYLHQRSFKKQKYLQKSTKRKSQNLCKTGLKTVCCQIFKSSQKSGQKVQVAQEKILVAKWCQK